MKTDYQGDEQNFLPDAENTDGANKINEVGVIIAEISHKSYERSYVHDLFADRVVYAIAVTQGVREVGSIGLREE